MGTRAKIKLEANGRYIGSKYINMDGHVENWAPTLITALNQTTPESIRQNRQLLRFMYDDYLSDDIVDYLCKIDASGDEYQMTIHSYGKELLFEGSLDEFSERYDEI